MPISFTFTGRTEFMRILIPYLVREREASGLKKHVWFLHTDKQEDIDYAIQSTKDYPGFFEVLDTGIRPGYNTHLYQTAYKHFTEPGQVYIKLDDDICFIEKGAIGRLAQFKRDHPEYFMVLANVVNNGICSHLHQKFGALRAPDKFTWRQDNNTEIMRGGFDPAVSMCRIHESFFENWKANKLDLYKFHQWILWEKDFWVSINMFAVMGEELAQMGDKLDKCLCSDERFMAEHGPRIVGKNNCICGDALVCHYAFRMQGEVLDTRPELLEEYKLIGAKETCHA